MDDASCSRDVLLAWINRRLEVISETQHRLAVERSVLQEQATRLRLGVAAEDVRVVLKRSCELPHLANGALLRDSR
jgi:hypothetical protein